MSGLRKIRLSLCCIAMLLAPAAVAAEGFTGEDFLQWSKESQEGLIDTSITMIGIVATQGRKDISHCIDDWYSSDEAVRKQRRGFLIGQIRQHSTFHPQAVILANVQKRCGSFKDKPS